MLEGDRSRAGDPRDPSLSVHPPVLAGAPLICESGVVKTGRCGPIVRIAFRGVPHHQGWEMTKCPGIEEVRFFADSDQGVKYLDARLEDMA